MSKEIAKYSAQFFGKHLPLEDRRVRVLKDGTVEVLDVSGKWRGPSAGGRDGGHHLSEADQDRIRHQVGWYEAGNSPLNH